MEHWHLMPGESVQAKDRPFFLPLSAPVPSVLSLVFSADGPNKMPEMSARHSIGASRIGIAQLRSQKLKKGFRGFGSGRF